MIDSFQLLKAGFFENPFQRYADTRYFYPGVSEQRKVLSVASDFIMITAILPKIWGCSPAPLAGAKACWR